MTARITHWTNGSQTHGQSGRTSPVFNPATGVQTAEADLASRAEVEAAVVQATEAAHSWRSASLAIRTGVLFRFRELLAESMDELAAIVTAEHGKVLSDAKGEIQRGLENVEYACGVAEHMKGGYSEQAGTGVDVYSIRQPLGVVAGITPFNFPVNGPAVDVCQRDRHRQRVHPQAEREGPVGLAVPGQPVEEGRPARRR